MLIVEKTNLENVLLIKPFHFQDHRGVNGECYSRKDYQEAGITIDFVLDSYSASKKNVLRGLHGDDTTWKLVTCLQGKIYFVVANNDPTSPQYRQWQAFDLGDHNGYQVLVPPKFLNGHLALTDTIAFHYKWSEYFDPVGQVSVRYNDPAFNISWPIENPILSERDRLGKYAS